MAKYCGNCGAEMDDNAVVCGQCGTPFAGTNSTKISGINYQTPQSKQQKEKNKKTITLIIAAVVAMLVVIGAVRAISEFTGYKGLVRKTVKAYQDYDIDGIIEQGSDLYYFVDDDTLSYGLKNIIDNKLEKYEDCVGHSYQITYKITDDYELSTRKLEDLKQTLSYYIGMDEDEMNFDDISSIRVVELELTVKQDKKSMKDTLTLTVDKEKDGWKLLNIE